MSHIKIMKKAASALKKDADRYSKEAKKKVGRSKLAELEEMREAKDAASSLKKRAKKDAKD